jgi:hypothetical protein
MNRNGFNWKDNGSGGEARAARAIGGRYRIIRHGAQATSVGLEPTYVQFGGDPFAYSYSVEYRGRDGNWRDIRLPRGAPGTLAEAKRMAEEDHAVRIHRHFECKEESK